MLAAALLSFFDVVALTARESDPRPGSDRAAGTGRGGDRRVGLYTADESGTWFPRTPTENWLQYDTLHLITIYWPVDIVFTPDGAPHGYHDLAGAAVRLLLEDEAVLVITTATWEALKQASGRAKDLEHLDRYYDGRDER